MGVPYSKETASDGIMYSVPSMRESVSVGALSVLFEETLLDEVMGVPLLKVTVSEEVLGAFCFKETMPEALKESLTLKR